MVSDADPVFSGRTTYGDAVEYAADQAARRRAHNLSVDLIGALAAAQLATSADYRRYYMALQVTQVLAPTLTELVPELRHRTQPPLPPAPRQSTAEPPPRQRPVPWMATSGTSARTSRDGAGGKGWLRRVRAVVGARLQVVVRMTSTVVGSWRPVMAAAHPYRPAQPQANTCPSTTHGVHLALPPPHRMSQQDWRASARADETSFGGAARYVPAVRATAAERELPCCIGGALGR